MKTCEFEGCERPVWQRRPNYQHGLCRSHYKMDWAGKPLKPIREYNETKNGKKVCSGCQRNKTVDEYYRRPNGVICSRCAECMREDAKRHREAAKKKKVDTESTQIKGEAA